MTLLSHPCRPLRFSFFPSSSSSSRQFKTHSFPPPPPPPLHCFPTRSSLPFPPEKAKHYRELEVAVDAVQRACRLCIDVKKSLFLGDERIVEKNDQTPVTVADFGVQALISLGKLADQFALASHARGPHIRSCATRSVRPIYIWVVFTCYR